MQRHSLSRLISLALATTLVECSVNGDVLYLVDGRLFVGEIISQSREEIAFRSNINGIWGTVTFRMSEVDLIVAEAGDQSDRSMKRNPTSSAPSAGGPSMRSALQVDVLDSAEGFLMRSRPRDALQVLANDDRLPCRALKCIISADLENAELGVQVLPRDRARGPLTELFTELRHVDQKDARTIRLIADILALGLVDGADANQARDSFLAAAEKGDALAQVRLASYLAGGDALKWLRKADAANPLASLELYYKYLRGHGVKADPKQALAFLKSAALRGNVKAMVVLAERDPDKQDVEKLLVPAYEAGSARAALVLVKYGLSAPNTDIPHLLAYAAERRLPEAVARYLEYAIAAKGKDLAAAQSYARAIWDADLLVLGSIGINTSPESVRRSEFMGRDAGVIISGRIQNLSNTVCTSVTVHCRTFDSNGNFIAEGSARTDSIRTSGGLQWFIVHLPKQPATAKWSFDFDCMGQRLRALDAEEEVVNVFNKLPPDWGLLGQQAIACEGLIANDRVKAMVRNITSHPLRGLDLIYNTFTSDGFLLDHLTIPVELNPLLPDQRCMIEMRRPRLVGAAVIRAYFEDEDGNLISYK